MDKIRVDTDLLEDCAGLIGNCGTSASGLAQEIAQVLSSLPESCTEKYSRVINSYKREMQSISNDLGFLKTGINKAVQLFEECEQALAQGTPQEIGKEAFDSFISGVKSNIDWNSWPWSWIDAVLDFFNIDKYGRDYVDPGAEAQQARDNMMRSQIEELFYSSYFSDANWDTATTEEKKQILNDFKKNVNSIFGTNVTADVQYFKGESYENGYYDPNTNKIYLNENTLDIRSREELMTTVVHEMRHAYQRAVVNDPSGYIVSEETAKAWEQNNIPGNYIEYDPHDPAKTDYNAYHDQPIEADAFGFSESVNYDSHERYK
ncbi:MAG: hypothetical protein IKQ41_07355 [Clostridia bacterium]|nr:hypothetical protein [Clostridia bacterium]